MSVITSYHLDADTDMVSILKDKGMLKAIRGTEGSELRYDKNGGYKSYKVMNRVCEVDLSKLWPEDWDEYSKALYEHGFVTFNDMNIEYCKMHYLKYFYENHMPEGMKLRCYGEKEGKLGYYAFTESPQDSTFIPFTDNELVGIKAGAQMVMSLFKKLEDSEYGYRRDYTDEEKKILTTYNVTASEDGKSIWWHKNYGTDYDSSVADYIAHALPDVKVHLHESIEGDVLYDGYSENGEFKPLDSETA